ncbi:MAG: hypothetical protein ABI675_17950 [Chitinophagaceae bacterium]
MIWMLLLVTFITAFIFTYINVFNSKKFGNYFFLIRSAWSVLFYCFIYGLIGMLLFVILKEGVISIDTNNTKAYGPYLTAFATGVATKGVADIKFFDINIQGEPFPIGLRSVTQFLDNQFDKQFDSIGFTRFLQFITPFQQKYEQTDLAHFKQRIIDVLASHPSNDKVAAFTTSVIEPAGSTKEILGGILREFGKGTLKAIDHSVPAIL